MKLSISPLTVHKHLQNVRKILHVHKSIAIFDVDDTRQYMQASPLRLTPRGLEVFMDILKGLSTKEVAENLGMSTSCVRRHKEKMLLQNNCGTMMELIARHYAQNESLHIP